MNYINNFGYDPGVKYCEKYNIDICEYCKKGALCDLVLTLGTLNELSYDELFEYVIIYTKYKINKLKYVSKTIEILYPQYNDLFNKVILLV